MRDGSAPRLRDAILKHGGEARSVREKYRALGADGQTARLAFLETLKAPPDAPRLSNPAVTRLGRK